MKRKRCLRHPADVRGVGRGAASSAWRTHAQTDRVPWEELRLEGAAETKAPLRSRLLLLTSNVLAWAWNYTRYVFRRRYRPFPTWEADDSHGLIEMEGSTIALAGDWGSGTYSAYQVADRIRELEPDYTVHLGDVYYSGTKEEFDRYFLPEDAWPEGKKGTFALNGNHEMYSGGRAYFEALKTEKLSYEAGGVR
ncbi:MAG: metallophosphoesterase, partial [Planctomycetota bacterium]